MDNVFFELKNYSREKAVETETEVEKTIIYVVPLLLVFFTSNSISNFWGYLCIFLLLFSMIFSLINLTILRRLFLNTFNCAYESEKIEINLDEYNKGNIKKEDVGELPNTNKIISTRNWFNGFFKLSITFFLLSIISLILFLLFK